MSTSEGFSAGDGFEHYWSAFLSKMAISSMRDSRRDVAAAKNVAEVAWREARCYEQRRVAEQAVNVYT
jgi:hypothetical protein